MGTDPQTSVTDVNGRFHKVANAFCADQSLFVTLGSVNPTLTDLVLTRKVAQAAVALATGTSAPPSSRFRPRISMKTGIVSELALIIQPLTEPAQGQSALNTYS